MYNNPGPAQLCCAAALHAAMVLMRRAENVETLRV